MPDQINQEKSFRDKLKDSYRLIIRNNETFQEVGNYNLTRFQLYLSSLIFLLLFSIFIFLLIGFTPLKRLVPGYGKLSSNKELVNLNKKVLALENELSAQKLYTDNFRKIMVGDLKTINEVDQNNVDFPDSLLNVERIKEDEQLRREIDATETLLAPSKPGNNSSTKPLELIYLVPPIKGTISAGFDANNQHFGVDILAPKGSPIKTIMDGVVVMSDWTLDTGHTIGIQHSNNIFTFYKHNSAILKKTGSYVHSGEAIAIIGNSGTLSTGPHLHFELWQNGQPVNPTDFISFE